MGELLLVLLRGDGLGWAEARDPRLDELRGEPRECGSPLRNAGAGHLRSLLASGASNGNVYVYTGQSARPTYVAFVQLLPVSPSPAAAFAERWTRIPYSGGSAVPVTDGGAAFVGDQLRVDAGLLPGDSVQPLLEWRLDYDFHDGDPLDSNGTTYRLKQPDTRFTTGGAFPAQVILVGPCDPAQVPQGGSAPVPATGAGCWESVTTNGAWTVPGGYPISRPSLPPPRQLTIGFEVQNALNGGSSSLATHRVTWKIPRQVLKNSSLLSGGERSRTLRREPAGQRLSLVRRPRTGRGGGRRRPETRGGVHRGDLRAGLLHAAGRDGSPASSGRVSTATGSPSPTGAASGRPSAPASSETRSPARVTRRRPSRSPTSSSPSRRRCRSSRERRPSPLRAPL